MNYLTSNYFEKTKKDILIKPKMRGHLKGF